MSKARTRSEKDDVARTVLVVDNDKRTVDLIKEILEYEGYTVVPAYCGVAAAGKAKEAKFACAILDYALPDMKGDELIEHLRLVDPEVVAILLSGFTQVIPRDKLNRFSYVFEKPIQLAELLAAVQQITTKRINERVQIKKMK